MKNRIILFILAFVAIGLINKGQLSAQGITATANNTGWINVNSYNGKIQENIFYLRINIAEKIKYPDWSLMVRASSAIKNSENKTIDPSKISIRLNRIEQGPTLGQIGVSTDPIPLSLSDKFILEESNIPLERNLEYTNSHQWVFAFDIIVVGDEGLNYMEVLKGYNDFMLNLTFTVVAANKSVLAEPDAGVVLRIYPQDTPPSGPNFGFEVNANATLDFNTPEQYTREVGNDPNNSWINVISKNSGYVINVKTNNPNFELIRNDSGVSGDATIPVNVVNVEMQSAGNGTSQGPKTLSSTIAQTLFIGTQNNNPQKLPVRYFITKTEAEKLATKTSGEYRAILTYTLEPN